MDSSKGSRKFTVLLLLLPLPPPATPPPCGKDEKDVLKLGAEEYKRGFIRAAAAKAVVPAAPVARGKLERDRCGGIAPLD